MNRYFTVNEWSIIEDGFNPANNKLTESIFSIGNGRMGQRANFEEKYSGETQRGHYVAGIYYPFKNTAGNQQDNAAEYTARLINAPNWIGIDVEVDGEELDLGTCKILDFRRELNISEGYLERTFRAQLPSGKEVEVSALRFVSIADDELGAIRFAVMPLNFSGHLTLSPNIDATLQSTGEVSGEKIWEEIVREVEPGAGFISARTEKTNFVVCTGMRLQLEKDGAGVETTVELISREKYIANRLTAPVQEGEQLVLYKYAAVVSSENYPPEKLTLACSLALDRATQIGFAEMLDAQTAVWGEKWQESDIVIKGDAAAQQGIRYNIFQLHQSYTGEDERLSIGRNGFTGNKYGGLTYWETEALCLPFYLATADQQIARNLLLYRYQHLPQAIENAQKQGFNQRAALFPVGTINGEECCPEMETNIAAIHRNGAIAYANYYYGRYTGDTEYLQQYGLEVLVGIARFLAQQINWNEDKNKYELFGVTNQNEDSPQINGSWYTATLASWTLDYTLQALQQVKQTAPTHYEALRRNLNFDEQKETAYWQAIINKMYYPVEEAKHYSNEQQIIKQPVMLQSLLHFADGNNFNNIPRNYIFNQNRAGHESPLWPGIQALLAAKTGEVEKAYDYFLQAARYDLDNYLNETQEGCHITTMAGTWQAIVMGFGGMSVFDNQLHFEPVIPKQWQSYTFKIRFQGYQLDITISQTNIRILNQADKLLSFYLYGKAENIPANDVASFSRFSETV